jgi:hypothetical protein
MPRFDGEVFLFGTAMELSGDWRQADGHDCTIGGRREFEAGSIQQSRPECQSPQRGFSQREPHPGPTPEMAGRIGFPAHLAPFLARHPR